MNKRVRQLVHDIKSLKVGDVVIYWRGSDRCIGYTIITEVGELIRWKTNIISNRNDFFLGKGCEEKYRLISYAKRQNSSTPGLVWDPIYVIKVDEDV